MGDPAKGLFDKFRVERTDGTSAPGQKHDACRYFVLDLDHDEFAMAALKTYAKKCRRAYPRLADDLTKIVDHREALKGQFFTGRA